MTATELATRLHAKPAGAGWVGRCPAHDDQRASLSIGTGADGRTLLKCHAQCGLDAILAAAGLVTADLFHETTSTKATIRATYDYQDEFGTLLYQVVRLDPKDFKQRRPVKGEGWAWKLGDVRRVLYRLPHLRAATVYVVEGEKDADRLAGLKVPATTNAGGAGKWRDDYTQQLKGASVEHVVILPDNDRVGRQHAEDVARSCHAAGLQVKIVPLPDQPDKADVSDWLDAGHTRDELAVLVTGAPLYGPGAPVVPAPSLGLTTLADLLREPDETVDYIVEDRIPAGGITLLTGKPKAGKSTTARDLAFAIGSGGRWLGHYCTEGPVWLLALEEKRSEVRKHFRTMGATGREPIRVFINQAPVDIIAQLLALATKEQPVAIIVDTLQRLIKAKDLNDYAETTTKMDPLIRLARDTGAALILLHHSNKFGEGLDAILGSTALAGSVDNVLMLTRTEKYRLLSSVQRIGPDLPETIVALDGHTGRVTLTGSRKDADETQMAGLILQALSTAGKALTEPELEDLVEGRTGLKRAVLRQLTSREQVSRLGKGGKGDPYHYAVPVPCSLVPIKSGEQENKNLLSHASLDTQKPFACSHVLEQEAASDLDRF